MTIELEQMTVGELHAALMDARARLVRAHDDADKYQIRALEAEGEVRRLRQERDDVDLDETLAKLSLANIQSSETVDALNAEVRRLQEHEQRCFAQEAEMVAEMVKLTGKLARIEKWYARTTTRDREELLDAMLDAMDELGNTILRG